MKAFFSFLLMGICASSFAQSEKKPDGSLVVKPSEQAPVGQPACTVMRTESVVVKQADSSMIVTISDPRLLKSKNVSIQHATAEMQCEKIDPKLLKKVQTPEAIK
jgi:hypothetical protein